MQKPATHTKSRKPQSQAIISPTVDFIFLGGPTLVILPALLLADIGPQTMGILYLAAFYLGLLLNFPHLISSYLILYRGYWDKISRLETMPVAKFRYLLAGIISPALLIGFLVYAVLQDTPHALGLMVNLMFFTTGWHYCKQGYGILMIMAVRKGVYFTALEKNILLANAYIIWLLSWVRLNATAAVYPNYDALYFEGFYYYTFNFPPFIESVAEILLIGWSAVFLILLARGLARHKALPINGFVAYIVSIYPWVLLVKINPVFFLLAPAFHGLQYLLFVWKMKFEQTKQEAEYSGDVPKSVMRQLIPFFMIALTAGSALFYFLPMLLSPFLDYDRDIFGPKLAVVCALVFLNIHHYFVDFAIWRKDNPDMKYLLQ